MGTFVLPRTPLQVDDIAGLPRVIMTGGMEAEPITEEEADKMSAPAGERRLSTRPSRAIDSFKASSSSKLQVVDQRVDIDLMDSKSALSLKTTSKNRFPRPPDRHFLWGDRYRHGFSEPSVKRSVVPTTRDEPTCARTLPWRSKMTAALINA